MGIESNILRYLLRDVYFITGTAYAGKSTMVRLLAERYDGVFCGENYHSCLEDAIDPQHQPALCYINENTDWQAFVSRTPEEYNQWIINCGKEAAGLEIALLLNYAAQGRKIFVDTNIPLDILHEIADPNHVLIMLSPQDTSVNRFFEREDAEKQFLYQVIMGCPEPEKVMANFRECLRVINSDANYKELENSGFRCLYRDDRRTVEETLTLVCETFGLERE
ncbi:MAG: hypothetical protein E7559_02075 [Ruminococcaceae bacterium]|nr:hypothetical protein [Oscillospiraceae bacterium]